CSKDRQHQPCHATNTFNPQRADGDFVFIAQQHRPAGASNGNNCTKSQYGGSQETVDSPGQAKDLNDKHRKTPTATAPPTGASHNSVVVVENRAVTGSNATDQIANKPAIPKAAEISQR